MEIFEDCVMWVYRVGRDLVVVTAYNRIIRAGDAVIHRIEVTGHIL